MAEINVGRVQGAGIRYSSIDGNSSTNNFALSTLTPTVADLPLFADDLIIASNGLMYKSNANYTSANSGNLAVTYVTNIKGDAGSWAATGNQYAPVYIDAAGPAVTFSNNDTILGVGIGEQLPNTILNSVPEHGRTIYGEYIQAEGNTLALSAIGLNISVNKATYSCVIGSNIHVNCSSVMRNLIAMGYSININVDDSTYADNMTIIGSGQHYYTSNNGFLVNAVVIGHASSINAMNNGRAESVTSIGSYNDMSCHSGGNMRETVVIGSTVWPYCYNNGTIYRSVVIGTGYQYLWARNNGTAANSILLGISDTLYCDYNGIASQSSLVGYGHALYSNNGLASFCSMMGSDCFVNAAENGITNCATTVGYGARVMANVFGNASYGQAIGSLCYVYANNNGCAYATMTAGAQARIYAYSAGNAAYSSVIGVASDIDASDGGNCAYSTAIGYNAHINGINTGVMLLGASDLSELRCAVELTSTSDDRDKIDILQFSDNICYDFLTNLNTFTYRRNPRNYYQYTDESNIENYNVSESKDGPIRADAENVTTRMFVRNNDGKYHGVCNYDKDAHANGVKAGTRRRAGLSAQNVEEMMNKYFGSIDYADLVNDDMYDIRKSGREIADDAESALGITYARFIPIIISAMKAERKRLEELEARVLVLEGGA